jgi:hypothetical protein
MSEWYYLGRHDSEQLFYQELNTLFLHPHSKKLAFPPGHRGPLFNAAALTTPDLW